LLDTHAWIWLFNGSTELSQDVIEQIDLAGNWGKVFISAISVWELSMLVAKNRVNLSKPIHQWVKDSFSQPGVNLSSMLPEIAIESSFLPGEFHGDPADRIIVATARINSLILLTRDEKILSYGKQGYVNCLKI
jgi:PIN domain nuclease of toxin-antitoxin system